MTLRYLLFRVSILCLIAFLSILQVSAQFTLSAELRPRTELRHGYKTLFSEDDKAAFFTSQRTRLNASYSNEKLKFGLSLQDVRVWGDVAQSNATDNQLMLHQAWAEYMFTKEFSMKIGRQQLNYDDARIFGNADWLQQARSHDLALFKFEKSFKIHLGLAYNQDSEKVKGTDYNVSGNYKNMQFLWFNKKIESFGVSLLFLNNGLQNKSSGAVPVYTTAFNQTYGTRLIFDKGKVSMFGATYYTTGEDISLRDLSAYYASLGASYKLSADLNATLGWELLSGTSQKKVSKSANYTNNSFSPFYGTNHKFNGYMDYFYVGNHLNSVGLNDIYTSLTFKKKKFSADLTPHFFSVANEVLNPKIAGELMASYLGTEIDLTFGCKLADYAQITAGYSQMFGTETLKTLKGGDHTVTNNWAYIMFSFNPVFIK